MVIIKLNGIYKSYRSSGVIPEGIPQLYAYKPGLLPIETGTVLPLKIHCEKLPVFDAVGQIAVSGL